uniref:Uncharacterized protein n=1 Tax=Avena sativa TaxID=4498 RepID=A0ACD6A198_AVESA
MGRLKPTAAVILDDGIDDIPVHSRWALVGKVLAPNTLHISTISTALRAAWGNPRGLLLNPAGDNRFVAEFATKADTDRVVDGPPWVVGKHAVLLKDFNIDLKPSDVVFNGLKIWARIINLPFGYMHKKWGGKIAGSLGIEGSVPVVDCDGTGRCWGSFMRCKDPGERDENGRLPYSADRLLAPDERRKKQQGNNSSGGSVSAGQSQSSTQGIPKQSRAGQPSAKEGGLKEQSDVGDNTEASSPIKKRQPRARTSTARASKTQGKDKGPMGADGGNTTGQKRKQQQQVYRARPLALPEVEVVHPLVVVVHNGASLEAGAMTVEDEMSSDSNKKMKTSGSADQAGAVEQPRQTQ